MRGERREIEPGDIRHGDEPLTWRRAPGLLAWFLQAMVLNRLGIGVVIASLFVIWVGVEDADPGLERVFVLAVGVLTLVLVPLGWRQGWRDLPMWAASLGSLGLQVAAFTLALGR